VLLPRESKRRRSVLKRVAIVLLFGRWLDVYLLVAPQTAKAPSFGVLEIALAVAYGGIAWYAVSTTLARRPLVARHDPCLADCLRHAQ
ncbi:MAG: quinol:cytochrome C oxidoreductase, partial [Acidobacteria bacterium]